MKDVRKYILQDLNVAIVDDQALVLEGLKSILITNHIKTVSIFHTGQDLVTALQAKTFDIYIVDVDLHDMSSIEMIDQIRARHTDAKIIVNTVHDEVWLVRQLINKQVNAVLYKPTHTEEVLDAISEVLNGKSYLCPEFKKLVSHISQHHDYPSQREIDVLKALGKGLTSKEIAQQLFISENTVEAHRKNLFAKLKARNIADLMVKAISQGYINPLEQ